MKQFALMAGAFVVTFALLIAVWMVGTGRPPFGAAATPTPAPTTAPAFTPVPTAVPSASNAPTASTAPTATATATATLSGTAVPATPSPSPAPMRTAPPSFVTPSSQPGVTETYTLLGKDFSSYDVPENASLLLNGDSLVLRTTDDSTDALWVTYRLDPALLPAGATVHSVSLAICGTGTGFFWEVYGPVGSDPLEYEVTPPEADGCWHFRDSRTTDLTAIAATMMETTMVIDRLVYTVTFAG